MSRRHCILCCESKFVFSHIIITTNLTLITEKRPAPALVDQPLQPFHHQTPARIVRYNQYYFFICIDKSPGLSFHYDNEHLVYESTTVGTELHESFTNHLEIRF